MKKIIGLTMIVVLSFALITGCGVRANGDDAAIIEKEEKAIPIKTGVVVKKDMSKSVYTIGEVSPSKSYTVNSKNNGDVLTVNYQVGDVVKEGDVLFTIDTYDFTVDKDSKIYQLTNALTQSQTSLNNAKDTFDEKQALFSAGAISQTELDGAQTAVDNAQISYNNTLDNYRSTKKTFESRADDYKVTSPIDGVVTGSTIEEGMFASTQNGFTIVVADSLKINANVASKYINEIKKNQTASVQITSIDKTFSGIVKSVNLNSSNGSYPVEIEIVDADVNILPGMYADVNINTETIKDAVQVPSKAIVTNGDEKFIFVLKDDSRVKKVVVELGLISDGMTQIIGEVNSGDQIVILGQTYLIDNQLVNIVE